MREGTSIEPNLARPLFTIPLLIFQFLPLLVSVLRIEIIAIKKKSFLHQGALCLVVETINVIYNIDLCSARGVHVGVMGTQ